MEKKKHTEKFIFEAIAFIFVSKQKIQHRIQKRAIIKFDFKKFAKTLRELILSRINEFNSIKQIERVEKRIVWKKMK